MDVGLFMPYRLPETPLDVAFEWDMQVIRWADEYGLSEAWFTEHYTLAWEPWPAPELQIAAAIRETSRLKFGTGANLLPYHQPVALAHRLMALDHMSKGRLIAGFGAGSYPTDAQLFGTDLDRDNREMLAEATDVIKAIWAAEGQPVKIQGKYYSVDIPEYDPRLRIGSHWRPYTPGGPRTAIAAFSPKSATLKAGGARGDIPLSIAFNPDYLLGHWEAYTEGAESAGLTAQREDWRVVRDIIVGETDEQAMELALSTPIRRTWDEWNIPFHGQRVVEAIVPDAPDPSAVDAEYLARNAWVVGSVDTVVECIRGELEQCGGFGTLLVASYDCSDEPELFRRHLELLGREVAPAVRELVSVGAGSR
jgi:alkanesulfonate monooxygenase SsuD/methylene tetrahydromethanopterin reductase-like flavin-dependent oxidoreductase (luciferase family)